MEGGVACLFSHSLQPEPIRDRSGQALPLQGIDDVSSDPLTWRITD